MFCTIRGNISYDLRLNLKLESDFYNNYKYRSQKFKLA